MNPLLSACLFKTQREYVNKLFGRGLLRFIRPVTYSSEKNALWQLLWPYIVVLNLKLQHTAHGVKQKLDPKVRRISSAKAVVIV